jgi:glycosyltransferase involved in cell wall biosynthesis
VWNRGSVSATIESHPIHTSFLQGMPAVASHYRWYLPWFPAAIERFRLTGFDAVISTSHAVARAVPTPEGTFHMSYIHTPMRYVWDLEREYFPPGRFPWPVSWYVRSTCARLRAWDAATSDRPDALVTNSAHVAARIARHYRRQAEVIYGPVDLERFTPATGARTYDLVVGAFAPNKRVDLALEAVARLGRTLVVAGSGPGAERLRRAAAPGTRFAGWVNDQELALLYAGARALIFPGEEDFGLVPIEAMASGCPVVAYGRGGALETVGRGAPPDVLARVAAGGVEVVPGGVLFGTQSVDALTEALTLLDRTPFDPLALRRLAEPFDGAAFDRRFKDAFDRAYAAWQAGRSGEPAAAPRALGSATA